MNLHLPYYSQERSTTCGLAALRMVLAYYGDIASEKELTNSVKLYSFGTFMTDLGCIAVGRGCKVTCYTFHLSLLAPYTLPDNHVIHKDYLSHLRAAPKDKLTFESWKQFITAGGKLIWNTPHNGQLLEAFNRKIPAIISVNSVVLGRYHKTWSNAHNLIITGIEDKKVEVVDPDPWKNKGRYTLPIDLLLAALTVNAVQSSSYLFLIEPKR